MMMGDFKCEYCGEEVDVLISVYIREGGLWSKKLYCLNCFSKLWEELGEEEEKEAQKTVLTQRDKHNRKI